MLWVPKWWSFHVAIPSPWWREAQNVRQPLFSGFHQEKEESRTTFNKRPSDLVPFVTDQTCLEDSGVSAVITGPSICHLALLQLTQLWPDVWSQSSGSRLTAPLTLRLPAWCPCGDLTITLCRCPHINRENKGQYSNQRGQVVVEWCSLTTLELFLRGAKCLF